VLRYVQGESALLQSLIECTMSNYNKDDILKNLQKAVNFRDIMAAGLSEGVGEVVESRLLTITNNHFDFPYMEVRESKENGLSLFLGYINTTVNRIEGKPFSLEAVSEIIEEILNEVTTYGGWDMSEIEFDYLGED